MKRTLRLLSTIILWILIVNGLVAVGFVASNHRSLWLPEYGQGFWWALGTTFMEAPENILFIITAIIALFIYVKKGGVFNIPPSAPEKDES